LATAKGIAFGLGIPVIPFGTLQMIAFGVKDWGYEIFVALDARMKEVYYASFDDALREICPVAIAPPEQIVEIYPAGAILIGSAAGVIAPLLDKKGIPYKMAGIMSHLPSAVNLIGLEQLCPGNPGYDFDRLAELEPLYIRESSAQIKHQKMEQTK
ncbi:MAG: tRNA (adenosine(37)-N6)-threonylcarbamoyltransferase complex dimerization subunit type 1 TsaB, partial [Candidatus Cloacimonadaceae bacterium]|nr:tRNA (adenosine(37)-N6)-threonylcarbamoyltransferase complex dimerization subunit type 1 TsaB [Candidatus Cloacimonadaceae bacterium]